MMPVWVFSFALGKGQINFANIDREVINRKGQGSRIKRKE